LEAHLETQKELLAEHLSDLEMQSKITLLEQEFAQLLEDRLYASRKMRFVERKQSKEMLEGIPVEPTIPQQIELNGPPDIKSLQHEEVAYGADEVNKQSLKLPTKPRNSKNSRGRRRRRK